MKNQPSKYSKVILFGLASLSIVFVQCGGSNSTDHNAYNKSEDYYYLTEESVSEPYHYDNGQINDEIVPKEGFHPLNLEQNVGNEQYAHVPENKFLTAITQPLSTFSIDVDNASYTNIRRIIQQNQLPTPDAVRIEEMINYFDYKYEAPGKNKPFSINSEVAKCPWNNDNRLVRIGLQGLEVKISEMPANNLVFLLDVSGSMNDYNKLPLLKKSFKMMVNNLGENDFVSIVTYAGATGVVLPPTSCDNKQFIFDRLENLYAAGSTNGAGGIELAYQQAEMHLMSKGNNRIILATDGDFNVGVSNQDQLVKLMEEKRNKGIDITVLGFGMGNLKDASMEAMANNGNGNYFYIDSEREAHHTLVENLSGTLLTIAKDVKIQVEFNPAKVQSYRLIGYENRALANEDFVNDAKDAGELGAGHSVTAIYEVTPANVLNASKELKYQTTSINDLAKGTSELLTVKLRFKHPKGDKSVEISDVVQDNRQEFTSASKDFQLAACTGAFGMLLKNSQYKGDLSYEQLTIMTKASIDNSPPQLELLDLIKRASALNTLAAVPVH
ncbi:MAG: Ca-activated chloride channel family protein [Parvicellaceae bacterium]|jgi:Ca-activated chloride channel family protein